MYRANGDATGKSDCTILKTKAISTSNDTHVHTTTTTTNSWDTQHYIRVSMRTQKKASMSTHAALYIDPNNNIYRYIVFSLIEIQVDIHCVCMHRGKRTSRNQLHDSMTVGKIEKNPSKHYTTTLFPIRLYVGYTRIKMSPMIYSHSL